jgi:cytoskeletal protein CcmA (bactofilin family)
MSTLCDYQLIEPDIVVSKGDRLAGTISFDALLRVDGEFEGRLSAPLEVSCYFADGYIRSNACTLCYQAGVIVGPDGTIISKLSNLSRVFIEGRVVGNISNCESVVLKPTARVHGDISCRYLEASPGSTIVGVSPKSQ